MALNTCSQLFLFQFNLIFKIFKTLFESSTGWIRSFIIRFSWFHTIWRLNSPVDGSELKKTTNKIIKVGGQERRSTGVWQLWKMWIDFYRHRWSHLLLLPFRPAWKLNIWARQWLAFHSVGLFILFYYYYCINRAADVACVGIKCFSLSLSAENEMTSVIRWMTSAACWLESSVKLYALFVH